MSEIYNSSIVGKSFTDILHWRQGKWGYGEGNIAPEESHNRLEIFYEIKGEDTLRTYWEYEAVTGPDAVKKISFAEGSWGVETKFSCKNDNLGVYYFSGHCAVEIEGDVSAVTQAELQAAADTCDTHVIADAYRIVEVQSFGDRILATSRYPMGLDKGIKSELVKLN